MSLIYIFAASAMEAKPIRQIAATHNGILRCGQNELTLLVGAMGPRNARAKVDAALATNSAGSPHRNPDAVLVIGLCGGLHPSLSERRIVAYTECVSTESNTPLRCASSITDALVENLVSSGIRCDRVMGVTSPRIATTPSEKRELAKRTGADVVDMETYSIVQAAAAAGIPSAAIRVVSDSSEWSLPDFNRALNESGALDGRKALMIALGSPLKTFRLLVANMRAMQTLGKALHIVLQEDCFAYATR
jgi:nucleoside phosphorylase